MIRERIPEPVKRLAKDLLSPIPPHLVKNHLRIDGKARQAVRESLETHYYQDWRGEGRYTAQQFERELVGQLDHPDYLRRNFIPWLDHACPLRGRRVLEIGCGTGSFMVALAEQGAKVAGIDIDDASLRVARDRCRAYGVEATLTRRSADTIAMFGSDAFDLVVFSASLEHMTVPERLAALRGAWHIIAPGGALAVLDTPNRLWYFDQHTSQLPFYHWLPNDLAFQYAKFSPRENFREIYGEYSTEAMQHFLRRGRGVSFHEFELAVRPAHTLKVISSRSSYQGRLRKLLGSSRNRKYKAMLMSICPGVHEGFFDPSLELVIARD